MTLAVPPHIDQTAKQVLTHREYDAWRLHNSGAGHRRISVALGIAPTTARDTLKRAYRKLELALAGEAHST